MTTMCVCAWVCVCLHSAQVRSLLNLFEICKLLSRVSGRSRALINWTNWCLSQAAGKLTHTVTGGGNASFSAGRGRKKGGFILS